MLLDAVFTNARVTTLDPSRPTATSVGVLGGQIVGLDEGLDGCRARVVHDLGGASVVPGFQDAHAHLSARGQQLQKVDVSPASTPTLAAVYEAIHRHAETLPPDAWVQAAGYDDSKLDASADREGLDAAAGGRPVFVLHTSLHAGVLSTEAIRRLGYADPRDLPDVDNGWIERRDDGDPTGVVAERALSLVHAVLRPAPFEDHVEAIVLGAQASLAEGLTSVTEPGIGGGLTGNGPADLAAYQEAVGRGRVGLRMTVMPELSTLHELSGAHADDVVGRFGLDLGLRTGLGDDWLRVGAVKVFADGALTSRTAALRDDYLDRAGERGLFLDDPQALREQIVAAHRAGWQVATHAIGDAAVDLVLDTYEQAQREHPRPDARHRIEHCGMVHDDQIPRLVALGVVPVPQARFLSELGDAYLTVLGEHRGPLLYRQRSLVDAGLVVPGSSDCPVVDGAPLKGIQALVTRELPDGRVLAPAERLTPLEALRAFTTSAAWADHQEHRRGRLAPSFLADLVVLSDDPQAVDPSHIQDIEVLATVVGGEVRHGSVDRLRGGTEHRRV